MCFESDILFEEVVDEFFSKRQGLKGLRVEVAETVRDVKDIL